MHIIRNERYTKFTLDYAAAEDSIRNLWVQVCTEHNRILVSCPQPPLSSFDVYHTPHINPDDAGTQR